jgi:hypothetical protein
MNMVRGGSHILNASGLANREAAEVATGMLIGAASRHG